MSFILSQGAGFIEHRLDATEQFLGYQFPDGLDTNTIAGITTAPDGFVLPKPLNAGLTQIDGLGLFEFQRHMTPSRAVMIIQVQVVVAPTVPWHMYLTDGRGGGTSGDYTSTVDDPTYDIPIYSGTGPAVVSPMKGIGTTANFRFKTDAAVGIADAFCRVWISAWTVGIWAAITP